MDDRKHPLYDVIREAINGLDFEFGDPENPGIVAGEECTLILGDWKPDTNGIVAVSVATDKFHRKVYVNVTTGEGAESDLDIKPRTETQPRKRGGSKKKNKE